MSQEDKMHVSEEGKSGDIEEVIGPLISEVTQPLLTELKLLRESVDTKYSKLEEVITTHQQEVTD